MSWMRRLAAPLDRAILVSRVVRQTTCPPADDGSELPETKVDGRRFARLPARDAKGWPELRLPLPGDAIFRAYGESLFRRVATWTTDVSAEELASLYAGALLSEGEAAPIDRTKGKVRRVVGRVGGCRVEVAFAEPDPARADEPRAVGITQHAR